MDVTLKLTDKQTITWEYLEDDSTSEILFGGGAGGGKSFLGCAWLIVMCLSYPNTRWLMGRAKLDALKKTTLNTFFEVAKDWKLKEGLDYTYNANDKVIKFTNGSEILLKDLFLYPADPNFDSLGSLEITGAFIDEANQITEKAKNIVASRIRYRLDENNLIPKLLMSCNPSKGWVYEQFYKKSFNNTLEDYKKFIQALLTDNPHISRHYITQLKKADEITRKRLLEGLWEYDDNLSLFKYDSILEMFDETPLEKDKHQYYMTIDCARMGKDSTVIMVWDGFDVIRVNKFDKFTFDVLAKIVNDTRSTYNIPMNNVVIDADGVGGGLVDFLKGSIEFHNNAKAFHNENYYNLKTQCYYKLAELVNKGEIKIRNIKDEYKTKLIQELEVVSADKVDMDGKLSIISKDKIKQLISRSPDYSDSMMLRMWWVIKNKSAGKFDYEFFSLNF